MGNVYKPDQDVLVTGVYQCSVRESNGSETPHHRERLLAGTKFPGHPGETRQVIWRGPVMPLPPGSDRRRSDERGADADEDQSHQ